MTVSATVMLVEDNDFDSDRGRPPVPRVASAVRRLSPYDPTTSLGDIAARPSQVPFKLDWNEATIPPSPRVQAALRDALVNGNPLNWYPELMSERLRHLLAGYTGRGEDSLLVTNGSDDALALVCNTYLEPGDEVVVPVPTYTHFLVFAQAKGGVVVEVRFRDPLRLELDPILDAVTERTKLIYLVSPNNPTGVVFTLEDVVPVLESAPHAMVIVDEAYFEFWGRSVIELADRYENLVVTRTFSKSFGLAGARIGYLAAHPRTVRELRRLFNPKSVNALGQVAAAAAIEDIAYVHRYVEQVTEGKRVLVEFFTAHGFRVYSTPANYILLYHPRASEFCEALADRGIYVRDRSSVAELPGCIRISAGTAEQMAEVVERIRPLLAP